MTAAAGVPLIKRHALSRRLSVAPMMDRTDRHDRYFLRLISRRVLLYTEMIGSSALVRGDPDRLLGHSPEEHPLALQVGGSDPGEMAACAVIAEDYGFDEVNINVGCPSDRVQFAAFGACLMAEPERVAALVEAMGARTRLPVTVKSRIGIDDLDSYEFLAYFVRTVAQAGCRTFIVHARKAWLQGMSPRDNRQIPPLDYDRIHRLKQEFPDLEIVLNGGIESLADAKAHLEQEAPVDGVMIGRSAYHNPYMLARADRMFFGSREPPPSPHEILERFIAYAEREVAHGVPLNRMTRHILGLFQGRPGARHWRRTLSERVHRPGAGIDVIREAARLVAGPTQLT